MDLQLQRRPVAKYGKNKGRTVGTNFFATDSQVSTAGTAFATTVKKYPISPSSPDEPAISVEEHVLEQQKSPSLSPVLKVAHVTSHSQMSSSRSSAMLPAKASLPLPATESLSFEILSSGDERQLKSVRPVKKRKLIQTLKQVKPNPSEAQKLPVKVPRQALSRKQENIYKESTDSKSDNPAPKQRSTARDVLTLAPTADLPDPAPTSLPNAAKHTSRPHLKPVLKSKKQDQPVSDPLPELGRAPKKGIMTETDPSKRLNSKPLSTEATIDKGPDHTSATSTKPTRPSRAAMQTTTTPPRQKKRTHIKTKTVDAASPKRLRHDSPALSQTSAASPGSRLFSELCLSPNESPARLSTRDSSKSPAPSPFRRGRLRRIDMLDAPSEPTSRPATRPPSLRRGSANPSQTKNHEAKKSESIISRPALVRSSSSQTRQAYGKARSTYGKERSHLADMVSDDLDALSYTSSQEATQQLASQLAANFGPSQLQAELDLDSSSDDADDGVVALKLKSIHELRQAGSNDRAGRDLEGLLADIDPTVKDALRTLRIQACTKLFTNLSQELFTTLVLDQGLDRLALWSKHVDDKVSKVLLNMIFWRLLHAKSISPVKSRSILQAVASGTSLITNLGTLADLAKDRKENLTKQIVRDLQKFEISVLDQSILPGYEGEYIVPAAITLAALHDALQKMVEGGSLSLNMGSQSQRKIVSILMQVSQTTENKKLEDRFITKIALSLLKLFSGPLDDDLSLSDTEYVTLGDVLGKITRRAVDGNHEDLLQAVLHFAISLCNDRPRICRNFSESGFSSSTLHLVQERFVQLLQTADTGNEIDMAMLDSMILCLASLLNITEYDDSVRIRFAHQRRGPDSATNLEKLLAIYTNAAPQVEGATTTERIQLQVAFGYLSLLICNLCLDDGLWTESQTLLGASAMSISDVVASAKELLIHLQTVEMSQRQPETTADDTTMALDGISLRFSAILAAVKVA